MEDKSIPTDGQAGANPSVKNFFKNGRKPSVEEYTKVWIDMINHIERLKADQ